MKPTNEIILLYHVMDKEILRKIKYTLIRLNMRIKEVPYADYNKTIGYHIGLSNSDAVDESQIGDYNGADMDAPMMVMRGLTNNRMDQLLLAFRKAGIPKINYKAIVTEHNVHWDAMKLYQEIAMEHAKMQELEAKRKADNFKTTSRTGR